MSDEQKETIHEFISKNKGLFSYNESLIKPTGETKTIQQQQEETGDEVAQTLVPQSDNHTKLFSNYRIGVREPDIVIIDKEKWDHKACFFDTPGWLDNIAQPDSKWRKKWDFYKKWRYHVTVDMYEHNTITSWKGNKLDIRIWSEHDIKKQIGQFKKWASKRQVMTKEEKDDTVEQQKQAA